MNKRLIAKTVALGLVATLLFSVHGFAEDSSETSSASAFPPAKEGATLTPETPVAVVNGKPVSKRAFDLILNREMGKLNSQTGGMHASIKPNDELKSAAMNQLVDAELLYQESQKFTEEGLAEKVEEALKNIRADKTDEQFAEALKNDNLTEDSLKDFINRKISIDTYVASKIESTIEIAEDKVKEFYDANPDAFQVLENVQASHICVTVESEDEEAKKAALEKAEGLLKKVKDGADFAEVAKESSDCSTSKNGGDLGYFTKQMMPEPLTTPVFAMKVGEIAGPIEIQNMYHIVKLVDRKEARTVSLEEDHERIVAHLKRIEAGNAVKEKIKELRADAKIDYVAPHM